MIIQIRGTSGSGKTTIVKQIMELYDKPIRKCFRQGRKQPLYYRLTHPNKGPELAVIGHYETKCGGCDTISTPGQSYPIIFDTIRRNYLEHRDVLFEGLLISGDVRWTKELKDSGLRIIELDVSLEECLASVNERRRQRLEKAGKEFVPVNPNNTTVKHKLITRSCNLLKEHGIPVERLSRKEAIDKIIEWLNLV
jgi:hypothetical protein